MPTDINDVQFDCRYELTPPNDDQREEVIITVTVPSLDREVRQEVLEDAFPNEPLDDWDIGPVHTSFHDPPWDDPDEIEGFLNDLDGTSYIRYEDPYNTSEAVEYGPPRFHVRLEPDADSETVQTAIKDYYPGLVIDDANPRILTVIVSSHAANDAKAD